MDDQLSDLDGAPWTTTPMPTLWQPPVADNMSWMFTCASAETDSCCAGANPRGTLQIRPKLTRLDTESGPLSNVESSPQATKTMDFAVSHLEKMVTPLYHIKEPTKRAQDTRDSWAWRSEAVTC